MKKLLILLMLLATVSLSAETTLLGLNGYDWIDMSLIEQMIFMEGYAIGVLTLGFRVNATGNDITAHVMEIFIQDRINPLEMAREVTAFYQENRLFEWPLYTVIPIRRERYPLDQLRNMPDYGRSLPGMPKEEE